MQKDECLEGVVQVCAQQMTWAFCIAAARALRSVINHLNFYSAFDRRGRFNTQGDMLMITAAAEIYGQTFPSVHYHMHAWLIAFRLES